MTHEELINAMKTAAPAIGAATATLGTLSLLVPLGMALYKKMTQLPAYDAEQRDNHRKLIRYYEILYNACNPGLITRDKLIPDGWKLDEHFRPLHSFNMTDKGNELLDAFDTIKIKPRDIHNSARGMLRTIVKLFNSIESRTWGWGRLEKGCLEGMFFSELANWIVIELPSLRFDNEEDLKKLIARKDYCTRIREQVLNEESISGRNNPIDALKHIIVSIDAMIEETKELIKMTSFREQAQNLDDSISGMIAETFHIMYLMLPGDHKDEIELPVSLFIDPKQTFRPEIQDLKKQQSGRWLEHTLKVLDIRSTDFKAHQLLSITEAKTHLDGELVEDALCILPKHLRKNLAHPDWGHWEFLKTDVTGNPLPMGPVLKNIRQIWRDLISLYFIRKLLKDLYMIAPVFGEVWLYNDKEGKAILTILQNMVSDFTNNLKQSVDSYFTAAIELYDDKLSAKKIKKEDLCYLALRAAKINYANFTTHVGNISLLLTAIDGQAKKFSDREVKADKTKLALMETLVEIIDKNYRGQARYLLEYTLLKGVLDKQATKPKPLEIRIHPDTPTSHSESSRDFEEETRPDMTHDPVPTPTDENPPTIPPVDYEKVRAARFSIAYRRETTELNLTDCGLNQLNLLGEDILKLREQFKKLPDVIKIIRLSHNKFQGPDSNEKILKVAAMNVTHIISEFPASVTTVYLDGHGFERLPHEALQQIFALFPKTIAQVSFIGNKPLTLAEQLQRVYWPPSYHELKRQGGGDFMKIAGLILKDYTKGNNDFFLFLYFHWQRHHVSAVHKIVDTDKKAKTPEELMKRLETIIIDKDTKPAGSLARRYTFLAYHCAGSLPQTSNSQTSTPTEVEMAPLTHPVP